MDVAKTGLTVFFIVGSLADDLSRIKRGFHRQVDDVDENPRTPSNIKIRAGEYVS